MRQVPPADTEGGPLGGAAARMGIDAGLRFVRDLLLCELTERGLMKGREGASTADTGSPKWRTWRRPERDSSSSFVSNERCSRDGGGGERVDREEEYW